jgi:hypothetical protein
MHPMDIPINAGAKVRKIFDDWGYFLFP